MPQKPKPTPKIFFAAPFKSNEVLVMAVQEAAHYAGYDLVSIHEPSAPSTDIEVNIRKAITAASLVVGDVSNANPNVMWELGYARALNKTILILTDDSGRVPFDLKSTRVITYQSSSSLSSLVSRLQDAIEEAPSSDSTPRPTQASKRPKRHKVFFSYSHADAEYLDRMLVHLRPVERAGVMDLWSDTKLKVGDRWREEIKSAVDEARTAVLLISADFLASEFIISDELPPLLGAAESQGARIIPVIVKPSRFLRDESLSRFQALNDPTRPMIRMSEAAREELYAKLAEIIETEIAL